MESKIGRRKNLRQCTSVCVCRCVQARLRRTAARLRRTSELPLDVAIPSLLVPVWLAASSFRVGWTRRHSLTALCFHSSRHHRRRSSGARHGSRVHQRSVRPLQSGDHHRSGHQESRCVQQDPRCAAGVSRDLHPKPATQPKLWVVINTNGDMGCFLGWCLMLCNALYL